MIVAIVRLKNSYKMKYLQKTPNLLTINGHGILDYGADVRFCQSKLKLTVGCSPKVVS